DPCSSPGLHSGDGRYPAFSEVGLPTAPTRAPVDGDVTALSGSLPVSEDATWRSGGPHPSGLSRSMEAAARVGLSLDSERLRGVTPRSRQRGATPRGHSW